MYIHLKGYLRPIWNDCYWWMEDGLVEILRQIPVSIGKDIGMSTVVQSWNRLLWKIVNFLPLEGVQEEVT